MHNFTSFIKQGLKEWTTWLGIALVVFGWFYYKEINQLIKNVLTSPEMTTKIIDGLSTAFGTYLIIYKQHH